MPHSRQNRLAVSFLLECTISHSSSIGGASAARDLRCLSEPGHVGALWAQLFQVEKVGQWPTEYEYFATTTKGPQAVNLSGPRARRRLCEVSVQSNNMLLQLYRDQDPLLVFVELPRRCRLPLRLLSASVRGFGRNTRLALLWPTWVKSCLSPDVSHPFALSDKEQGYGHAIPELKISANLPNLRVFRMQVEGKGSIGPLSIETPAYSFWLPSFLPQLSLCQNLATIEVYCTFQTGRIASILLGLYLSGAGQALVQRGQCIQRVSVSQKSGLPCGRRPFGKCR